MFIEEGDLTSVLKCQYCGSKELIVDSENVSVEKIRQKAKKEIEITRMQYEAVKEQQKKDEEEIAEFRQSKLRKWIIAFAVICLLFVFSNFSSGNILRGMVALVQTGLFIASWLFGMNILNSKRPNIHRMLAFIGFLLIIVYIRTPVPKTVNPKTVTTYTWPSGGLADHIPHPPTEYGEINTNNSSEFKISTYQVSDSKYTEYLNACKEQGYVIDAEEKTTSYTAYNSDGYKLDLTMYRSWDELEIKLDAPIAMQTIIWPNSSAGKAVPEPVSKTGEIRWEHDNSFLIYIGNTSKEDFLAYTYLCAEKGFDKDYSRGDNYYYADSKFGKYHLAINYEGFNTMRIRVDKK